jgi:hypothetical protein
MTILNFLYFVLIVIDCWQKISELHQPEKQFIREWGITELSVK